MMSHTRDDAIAAFKALAEKRGAGEVATPEFIEALLQTCDKFGLTNDQIVERLGQLPTVPHPHC